MRHRIALPCMAFLAAITAIAIAGCSTASAPSTTRGLERISYSYQLPFMCGGRCEATDFVMTADGTIWSETRYSRHSIRDRPISRRIIHSTPAQFMALKERLAPYRPGTDQKPDEPECKNGITDEAGAFVEWWTDGEKRSRFFDFGCRDDPAMNEILLELPSKIREVPKDR